MAKDLERDLGLYATLTVSIGAMIGSGIFVLPGLASKIAGPAVVLAYLFAGLLVLPAALSKAEMATAMPESGGTYLYIDRAMGPLPGTVAGVGAWFSLVFKSAFALVGLGAYLLLFVDLPPGTVTFVSIGLAVLLVAVNVGGVKQSGRLQAGIVTLVLAVLIGFIADGITFVDAGRYHPFFGARGGGLLAATGFVFVSYAGVTKIASVAEEVEDPGRNIPLAILGSIALMMLVYTLVVFVVVGVAPPDRLAETLTPMALAAGAVAGPAALAGVAVVAVLALTSMANAGILSSSRFPLAMSRDDLAPARLAAIHPRFRTPVDSIALTGGVLVVLIAFVPVVDLAKLASAFQILVFVFVNAALVAFRESGLDWYDPEFVAPGYPWVQLAGMLGGVLLITAMGPLPLVGAAALVALGVAWYRVYGRDKTEREGAAIDAIRRTTGEYSIDAIERQFRTGGEGGTIVAVGPDTTVERESTLLGIAEAVTKRRGGRIDVARFEAVPDQVALDAAAEEHTAADEAFERRTEDLAASLDVPVDVEEVVSHDIDHAVVNHVERTHANLLVGEWQPEFFHGELLGRDVDWYMEHAPCDLVFVRDRGFGGIDEIVVVADRGPYDPLEVLVADAVAREHGASVRFVYALDPDASEEEADAIAGYHDRLVELCTVPTARTILRARDRETALLETAGDADLVVVSVSAHHRLYDVVFGSVPDRLASDLECTVLMVHSRRSRRYTFLRRLLERVAY